MFSVASLVPALSGIIFALLVLLIMLFTSLILRSWRQDLAIQTASFARKDRILVLLRQQQRSR